MLVGVDCLEPSRMEKLINNNAFLTKCLTKYESAYLETRISKIVSLAGIFCAKEAFLKALGLGLFNGISLNEIEVRHRDGGQPYICLSDNAKKIMNMRGQSNIELSITHTNTLAAAVCVLY